MIPVRDSNPSSSTPVANYTIIGINIAVFFIQLTSPLGMDHFIYKWGLVPAKYTDPGLISYYPDSFTLIHFFSFMFLHGGWLHLIGNMWSLFIFGDNVEDRLGSVKYVIFYILCGFISGFAHFIFNMSANIPVVGASGAIAGIMGAYFVLFPGARILTIIPIIIIPWFIEIPAFIFLGIWFLIQLLNAAGASVSGIAWWAHVSGFLAGALMLGLFTRLPSIGLSQRIKDAFPRKKTPDIITLKTLEIPESNDLLGKIEISSFEALAGCIKKINLPWGFYNRLYKVNVPPGIRDGQKLRLNSLGLQGEYGTRGDLYIEIKIRNQAYQR